MEKDWNPKTPHVNEAIGASTEAMTYHDLDGLIGKWTEDPDFDRAIELQNKIDEDIWK